MKKLSLLVVVVAVLYGTQVAPAFAADVPYHGLGAVFQQTLDGQPVHQQRIAIDRGTGRVYVTDVIGDRIRVFDPAGTSATEGAAFGAGELTDPLGVAVDQETGAIYVSDEDDVVKYASDGTLDPTFTSPGVTGPVAFDQNADELVVADVATNVVRRYSPAGTPGATFDGSDGATAFTGLQDLAIAPSGDVYVVDADGDPATGANTHVERYSAAGQHQATLGAGGGAATVAVNATGDRIVVSAFQSAVFSDQSPTLSVFDTADLSTPVEQLDQTGLQYNTIRGLAIGDGPAARLYVGTDNGRYPCECYGPTGLWVYERAEPAAVTVTPASDITTHGATLHGSVDAQGFATTYHFDYSLDDGTHWKALPVPHADAGSATDPVDVQVTLDGVDANTAVRYRLVAHNAAGTTTSTDTEPDETFTTAQGAPGAVTGAAIDVTADGAALNGTVNPYGLQASYHFEYGTTTAYGSRAPAGPDDAAGDGHGRLYVELGVSGLKPGTPYHYRLVATSSAGTTTGDDSTFTTDSPGVRGYEMVSPLDNGGVSVESLPVGFKARDDGDAVAYTLRKTTYPDAESAPVEPKVLGTRGVDGWSAASLDVPTATLFFPDTATAFKTVLATSEDLSRRVVASMRALGGQGIEGNGNLYVYDASSGQYTLVASSSDVLFLRSLVDTDSGKTYVGGSRDLTTFAFMNFASLTPDAPAGGMKFYVWSATSGLRFVSPSTHLNVDVTEPEAHQVSEDGARVYVDDGGVPALYEASQLTPIAVDHRTGHPPTRAQGEFAGASPDGRYALFMSERVLTDDAVHRAVNDSLLYRYDATTGQLTYLANGLVEDGSRVLTSPNEAGGGVYFAANLPQAGATGNPRYLYRVGDAGVEFIAPYDNLDQDGPAFASPDRRYLAFTSGARLTSYDNQGQPEIYLYDAQTKELTCPSCRTDGGQPTGVPGIAQDYMGAGWQRYVARSVTSDGQVFFDTPDPLVASDVNGVRDVYSYQHGRVTLISRGAVGREATFMDATPNGSDVFFVTQDRLVGQDDNVTADVYDARVGGGFASQAAKDVRVLCGGVECREADVVASGSPPTASERIDVPESKPRSRARARVSVIGSSFTSKVLRLTVSVSGRGRVRVAGAGVVTTTRSVARKGRYTLKVPLTKKARSARRAGRRVRVVARVSLAPSFGAPGSFTLTRTLGR